MLILYTMKTLNFLVNFIFAFALVILVLVLCLYNWRIDQILCLTYLLILCAFALFINLYFNSKF